MSRSGIKVDLHVHSDASSRPSQWILQKIDCPESFTPQRKLYEIAKARGMDLVTITDHNTLDGSLEIAHLPDTFLSEEITAYFPENRCKLHILAHDITEAHHRDITRLRENVYELVAYLNQEEIFHVLAHPLFDLNHKLTLSYFEKMLLLFKNFELNGSRDDYQNNILRTIVSGLTKKDMALLADKYGIDPKDEQPWEKRLTGGSDDHSSLNIARMHTFVPGATDRKEFFAGIQQGIGIVEGKPATPKTMAHNLYGIAYQFYKSKFKFDSVVHKDNLFRFVDSALTQPDDNRGILARLQDYIISKRPTITMFQPDSQGIMALIQQKSHAIIRNNEDLRKMFVEKDRDFTQKEEDWFSFVSEVSEEVLKCFADATLDSLSKAKIFNMFETIGSAGSMYTLLMPYFLAFRLFIKDRAFAEACQNAFLHKEKPDGQERKERIAIFTDTLNETNGVALTLRMQLKIARKTGKSLTVLTCYPKKTVDDSVNFKPVGRFELPEYPEVKLYYPPFLKMLSYCYENNFSQIQASTPGPVGLAALAISKILDIPFYGTYHTAFPQYVSELTGDSDMGELAWKAMVWFYNQMDIVYAPSKACAVELVEKGIGHKKIRLYPRGVDTKRFHPGNRNGFWTARYNLPENEIKLLYVGRISKEKNLDVLSRMFRQLDQMLENITLIIVGDGPYRKTMEKELANTRTLFTGYLDGEDLARAYASSDLFVFPSDTDTFGNVVLEAQASGVPVIVTDRGGPQENMIDGKTGAITPSGNAHAMADAIYEICGNPGMLLEMKLAARIYMKNRSFETAFDKSWELYHKKPAKEEITRVNIEKLLKVA